MPTGLAEVKYVLALLKAWEPNIRLDVRVPFNTHLVDTFTELLQDLARRLAQIADLGWQLAPEYRVRLAELVTDLEDYRPLAEQYYDPEAHAARLRRPLYEVAPDIDLICQPAKAFKLALLTYLRELSRHLAEISR